MHLHVPDPAFTASAQARAHFRLSFRLAAGFVALLWLIHTMNWAMDLDAEPFGVVPRRWAGLAGVVFAPLAHGDFAHLIANSSALLVLGTAMLFLYPRSALRVLPLVYAGPGIAVWLAGRDAVHLGASGLVYGLAAYVLAAGLLRRDRRAIAAALAVCLMYGSLVWGVLPTTAGVSWETHLAAALIGLAAAFALRRLDVPPRKRYSWEDEQDGDGDTDAPLPAEVPDRTDPARD